MCGVILKVQIVLLLKTISAFTGSISLDFEDTHSGANLVLRNKMQMKKVVRQRRATGRRKQLPQQQPLRK
jgi:hypothetical protein